MLISTFLVGMLFSCTIYLTTLVYHCFVLQRVCQLLYHSFLNHWLNNFCRCTGKSLRMSLRDLCCFLNLSLHFSILSGDSDWCNLWQWAGYCQSPTVLGQYFIFFLMLCYLFSICYQALFALWTLHIHRTFLSLLDPSHLMYTRCYSVYKP